MATYPDNHIFIIKVQNKTYVAFLSNQDHSRVKFLHNDEIVSKLDIRSYINRKYGKEPEWIRCIGYQNPFAKPVRQTFSKSGYVPTSIEYSSIRIDIKNKIGNPPSTDLSDYESNNDYFRSSRKEQAALRQRMQDSIDAYNEKASGFPTFSSNDSVTDYEICELMEWFASNDKEPPAPKPNYGGLLNF